MGVSQEDPDRKLTAYFNGVIDKKLIKSFLTKEWASLRQLTSW